MTYRAQRRNEYVSPRKGFTRFDGWRAWINANISAKLAQRREQCYQARVIVAKVITGAKAAFGARLQTLINDALLTFWSEQKPRTRVNSRIIRELAHA